MAGPQLFIQILLPLTSGSSSLEGDMVEYVFQSVSVLFRSAQ